jgi:hypothetical protein
MNEITLQVQKRILSLDLDGPVRVETVNQRFFVNHNGWVLAVSQSWGIEGTVEDRMQTSNTGWLVQAGLGKWSPEYSVSSEEMKRLWTWYESVTP